MNDTIKVLCERRSVRSYKDKQVPKEILDEILKCGTFAPSGMGLQSAVIIAIQDKELIKKIAKINASIMGRDNDPFYGAPTLVIVFAKKDIPTYIKDGSAVMTNILNAAFSLGVDSCWIDRAKETFETNDGKELLASFNLDDNYEGIGNIILGYRDGDLPIAKKRKENYIIYR
ncbi:MAG: nitroreductase family protein [Bacilli bacterium]